MIQEWWATTLADITQMGLLLLLKKKGLKADGHCKVSAGLVLSRTGSQCQTGSCVCGVMWARAKPIETGCEGWLQKIMATFTVQLTQETMSIEGMKWGHFIWNSSCHHIFRVDKLLLDNFFFFSISTAAVRPTKASQPGHRNRLWNNSRKCVFAEVQVTFKGNWLCLLGPIHGVGKFFFLHRMLMPWKTQFMISYFPLLLN